MNDKATKFLLTNLKKRN